jgi:hypothetical protein
MHQASMSRMRLYAPFLALVAVQALLVALLPSTSGADQAGFGGDPTATGNGAAQASASGAGGTGGPDLTDLDTAGGAGAGSGGATATQATAQDGGSTEVAADGDTNDGGGSDGDEGGDAGRVAAAGDTSHCTGNGRQHGVTFHAPECRPVFDGDNGGATYQGVTEDEITVVWFTVETNEQLEAISTAAGSENTVEGFLEFVEAVEDFIETHYETYGRSVNIEYFEAECPDTPQDVPACRAEARRMMSELDPFAVIWTTPLYPEIFDEFAREGVLSLGGWHFENQFFEGRRPFRWDLNMDGTQAGELIAEYYCTKLAGEPASHAGRVIHPSIGPRDTTERRLGILTPETEANVSAANHVRRLVSECSGQEDIPLATYESNIERAQEQSTANAATMISGGVTTMVCMCDPIAPIFTTRTYTAQGYFPEHLLAGIGFMDVDQIGRLYDSEQWAHAFGLSHIAELPPPEESDYQAVWEASGREGASPGSWSLPTSYFLTFASMVHNAGPNLTPATIEEGMFAAEASGGWEATGGDASIVKVDFGPGNYTAISDVREVYWDTSAISQSDGDPGAYVPMNDGRRYVRGEIPPGLEVPQPAR